MKPHEWAFDELAVAFAFAHDLFRAPSPEQFTWLSSDDCRDLWESLNIALLAEPTSLPLPAGYQEYESAYITTFDVGQPTPLVPLIESHYNKKEPVPRILHENVMFYQQFGLRLSSTANETADHLRHQLEFVSYLLFMRHRVIDQTALDRSAQLDAAMRDYLERHLLSWLPQAEACAPEAPLAMALPMLGVARALSEVTLRSARN